MGQYQKGTFVNEYFPLAMNLAILDKISIPMGEIAPVGNNMLAYLAKIITESQYSLLSTNTIYCNIVQVVWLKRVNTF